MDKNVNQLDVEITPEEDRRLASMQDDPAVLLKVVELLLLGRVGDDRLPS